MNMTRSMIIVVAGLGVLAFTSATGAQQPAPSNTKLQRTDRSFIQKAADGNQAEVELGRLAQEKGASDSVKQFGQRMVEDHGAANKELMELARNKSVKLEDKATQHDRLRDRLAKLQGQEFDREYVNAMVKDHTQDVAEFRRMHSGAVDPNLKAWVDKTLPTLEDHLKTIEGIQAQMTGSKK